MMGPLVIGELSPAPLDLAAQLFPLSLDLVFVQPDTLADRDRIPAHTQTVTGSVIALRVQSVCQSANCRHRR